MPSNSSNTNKRNKSNRRKGRPTAKRKSPMARKKSVSSTSRRPDLDWNPLEDSRVRAPVNDQPAMSIEERKAAQLEKWRKELGIDEGEEIT